MLRYQLLHPQLIGALASAGHGARVLIADANYPHATKVNPDASVVYLNLRPGQVPVDDILRTVLTAVPVEAAHVMQPDDRSTPAVFGQFSEQLGDGVPLQPLDRFSFYDTCKHPDLAVCIASGDTRLFANILLTIGALPPD